MDFQLQFLGAAGNVTGSRTLLKYGGKSYLVDCGLFQGNKDLRARNWAPFVKASSVDAVFLTHAHLDHSGYLPKLRQEGFTGKVHSTAGTWDLANILLRDSAKLQEEDADYANRTGHSHHKPAKPLYTIKDAEAILENFQIHPRNEWSRVGPDLGLRYIRSGHIIGSSFVQFSLGGGQRPLLVTFSGDVGHSRSHILRGPDSIAESDILILESTYGGRKHSIQKVEDSFSEVAKRTLARRGVLVIPAFAVGRAQEVIYLIRKLEDEGRIPSVPVILDSPMSSTATHIFLKHTEDHVPGLDFGSENHNFYPRKFQVTESQDESFAACVQDGPLIVISASGMLSGGRILHHLKKRLPEAKNTVLFVGYQAEGSKGRFLLDQGKQSGSLRIHHTEIPVECEIAVIESLSAHGDEDDLVQWLKGFRVPPGKVILNHGTPTSAAALAEKIRSSLGWADVHPLKSEETFSLSLP